jgi:hypothetical protein
MIELNSTFTMIGIVRKFRMTVGDTFEAIGVTALAFLIVQEGNIIQATLMLDVTGGAGEIGRGKLLTWQT